MLIGQDEVIIEINPHWTATTRRGSRRPGKRGCEDARAIGRLLQEAAPLPRVYPDDATTSLVTLTRERDRVLISGDALLTLDLTNYRGWLLWALGVEVPHIAIAPWYISWDHQAAKASGVALAKLEPSVIAGGHGSPVGVRATPDGQLTVTASLSQGTPSMRASGQIPERRGSARHET